MEQQNRAGAEGKNNDLEQNTVNPERGLTDNMGHLVSDDQNSLRAGQRGPTLMEDFHFREKIHHFDHERIPERVVHARGAGAHGVFHLTESLAQYTTAKVLTDTSRQTPVFVRFSTVAGSRGSADTARDVRGFAVRFYTQEGNWDIVGNNIPVFFIQDAIKFPDIIHAVKPEPHNEIPQAGSAHDTFWDFISLSPETMHMIMWVMSDRAIPRSFNTMEGFGVHTFRLINAQGQSHLVKFHWKPVLGSHSLVWDEAQKIAGKDPDFHRRTMYDDIEAGNFLEWDFGVQIFTEADAAKFDFDVLDATKIVPEDLVPVRRVGKLTLNRNPDNFHAETEQIGFMTSNIVPGIDFSDDPLLQGRNFSYLDTQLTRLGGPNWQQLPINRPVNKVSNNQRDGHMQTGIHPGRVSYEPNSLGGNIPNQVTPQDGGFASYAAPVSGPKVRQRSDTFGDHYGQAKLFWNSMTPIEKEHIVKALQFELSKVETREVRQRMLAHLVKINDVLASQVAVALGEKLPGNGVVMPSGTADSPAETALLANAVSPTSASGGLQKASSLSIEQGQPRLAKGRKVAILIADGVDNQQVDTLKAALKGAGAMADVIGPRLGMIEGESAPVEAKKTFANSSSTTYDAVFVPGGDRSVSTLLEMADAHEFVNEAYKHAKPIGAAGEGIGLLSATTVDLTLSAELDANLKADPNGPGVNQQGVVTANSLDQSMTEQFLAAIAQHRHWGRVLVAQPSRNGRGI